MAVNKRVATLVAVLLAASAAAAAARSVVPLGRIRVSASTGEKPQSKVWFHAGRWWTVLPTIAASPQGTWLWRLGNDKRWETVLHLTSATDSQADARIDGPLAHVFLHGRAPALVSLEYGPATERYALWRARPLPTPLPLVGSETATIDLDSTSRLWLATEARSRVEVYHADPPYARFTGPIPLATDVTADDVSVVTALPNGTIGVLWSNQRTRRFGFRLHVDGTDPAVWLTDEVPASQSAADVGAGMADDHLNVAVASDGTLYAAVKTSFGTVGHPVVALLVRRPDGRWDDLHWVDRMGTRPIVLLNEERGTLRVLYTSGERPHHIVFRESPVSPIAFGSRRILLAGALNDVSSTKSAWRDEVVVIAKGRGALVRGGAIRTPSARTLARRCSRGCVRDERICRLGTRLERLACTVACPAAGRAACVRACRRQARSVRHACRTERRACDAGCRMPLEPAAALCRASCGGQLADCLEDTPRAARACVGGCPRTSERPACLASCARDVVFAERSCQQVRAACLGPCKQ